VLTVASELKPVTLLLPGKTHEVAMALQKCNDCGTQMSTSAVACPKCGHPRAVALAPKPNAKRGTLIIVGAVALVGYFVVSGIYSTIFPEQHAVATSRAAPVPDPAKLKADYFKKVTALVDALQEMKVEVAGTSTDAMVLAVEVFNLGGQLMHAAGTMPLDANDTEKVHKLGDLLVRRQRQAFPIMRHKYGPIMARELWKNDIEVTTSGTRYATVAFVAGAFAAHQQIADAQQAILPVLMRLRFKRSEYRWIPSEEKYTYYTIESPADDAYAVVSKTGDVTLTPPPTPTT
jgi:DNA-directed RNA polymerase subunit RPC12/RpoP